MKLTKLGIYILLSGLTLQASVSLCLAHDNKTMHPRISDSAAQSSSGLKNFLTESFGYSGLDGTNLSFSDPKATNSPQSPVGWIKDGSRCEDVPWQRGNNHFYDPTQKPAIGLTDGWSFKGKPSFIWATVETNGFWGQHSYTWLKTRDYELNALTNSCKSGRETNLAAMLFYLGHVIHLNQDLTVPAHVRNDNHGVNAASGPFATFVMWTENYGAAQCVNNSQWFTNQPSHSGWSWWQNTAGFQKLEDFWNRDMLRTNGASALNNDAANIGRVPLGLSEFCNGNFISENATYGECGNSSKHTFSYPSLDGTTYCDIRIKELDNVLLSSIHPVFLNNGRLANRIYLEKKNDGIRVTNHCAMSYLGVALAAKGSTPRLSAVASVQRVSVSLDDTNVLQEYHNILIPKAVEYSAGILDYFFRGTIKFWVNGDDSQSSITVQNTSDQDFHDGAFFVLIETDGVRTLVQSNHLYGLLPAGGSTIFTCDQAATNKYFVFYQGTIGWTNNAALDLVDSNICVATPIPPEITVTANPLWTDSGLTVSTGQSLTISASGTWNWGLDECTDADGTDYDTTDKFLAGVNQGALIAYVGTHPPYEDDAGVDRWGDASYFPQSAGNGYWLVGTEATITSNRSGELWFLINDDAVTKADDDNSGSLKVTIHQ